MVNPAARRAARLEPQAALALGRAGVRYDVARTTCAGDARTLASSRSGSGSRYDAVFTLGGDGTAIEVLDALAHTGIPVGVLPGGTGNLLARALGVPLRMGAAVRALLTGAEAAVDLGRLDGWGRFAVAAGVGIDATMVATTAAPWKRRVGVLAYVAAGAAATLGRRRFRTRVTVDGHVVERAAAAVLVANFGTLLHGLITLGPGIAADDGVLDVCIFDPPRLGDAVRVARRLLLRDFRPDPAMTYLAGRTITIETVPPLPAQADGELAGSTPLRIGVDPLAVRLLVPQRGGSRQDTGAGSGQPHPAADRHVHAAGPHQ